MDDNKKAYTDMKLPEDSMYDMEFPMMSSMCPMMYGCPMMCPMMQIRSMSAPMMHMRDLRVSEWYEEDDSGYSSDESDEAPYYWKPYKEYKHIPFPFLWQAPYPFQTYSKKHKR
jgi:hypothetical protein